jgi:two-component system, OmpR family, heavy metal sensor histidine kinase CusS
MNHLSIRWRLTLWYSAMLAIILLISGTGLYYLMSFHLLSRLDRDLTAELKGIDAELEESSTTAGVSARLHRRFGHYENVLFDIRYPDGSTPLFSRSLGNEPFPSTETQALPASTAYSTYQTSDGSRWRIASRQISGPDGPLAARVAGSLTADDHELNELLGSFLVLGPLALLAAIGGGYLLARRALAAIDRMTREAHEISAHRLNRRLVVSNPHDELGRLATTLNGMIARLEKSFADMQQFTADAAHELRTPVTVMRNETEVTLRAARTPEEYRASLEGLLEECERLTRLADQLLYLCREDAGMTRSQHAEVQLDQIATEVADHMRALAQEKRIALALNKIDSCTVIGEPNGLRRLVFNLLDNAIKYTPDGGQVGVRLSRTNGHVELVVADTGVGIPAEHVPHVCNRFYRVDSSRQAGGTGLGLAICRAIVESHNGQINVVSAPNAGTTVTVTLN